MKTAQLTPNSWITTDVIKVNKSEYKDLLDLCPTTKNQVKLYGKLIDIPRFERLYGDHDYKYSGIVRTADPNVPALVKQCIDYVREKYPDYEWNGALTNWYLNGTHYIGAHSDDERDLCAGAPIISFSFGASRIFRIRRKGTVEKKDVITQHGMVIAMCGQMQKKQTIKNPLLYGYMAVALPAVVPAAPYMMAKRWPKKVSCL